MCEWISVCRGRFNGSKISLEARSAKFINVHSDMIKMIVFEKPWANYVPYALNWRAFFRCETIYWRLEPQKKTELTFDLFCVIFQRVIFLVSQFNLTQLSPAEIKIEPCESTEAAGSIPWRVESYQKKTNQQRTEIIQIITHFAYNGVFN